MTSSTRTFRFLALVSSGCILLLLFGGYRNHKSRNDGVTVQERTSTFLQIDIGSRKNLREGEIAAIQELSRRLDTEPAIASFNIVFHSPQRYYVEYNKSAPLIQCNQQTIRLTKHRSHWFYLLDYSSIHTSEPNPLYMGVNTNPNPSPDQIRAAAQKKMSVSDIVKMK